MSRYIDADAFEANMQNEWERNEISNSEWIHFREMINDEPTADVVPVVHGEWIEDAAKYYKMLNERELGVDEYTPYFTDDIACSNCLAKYSTIDNETQYFKFCPNCGASMMEGAEDDPEERTDT